MVGNKSSDPRSWEGGREYMYEKACDGVPVKRRKIQQLENMLIVLAKCVPTKSCTRSRENGEKGEATWMNGTRLVLGF